MSLARFLDHVFRPRGLRGLAGAAVVATLATGAGSPLDAQAPDSRFGVWRMRTDNPAPYRNVMTYEPWGRGGMRVVVESTSSRGQDSRWSYATLFDGTFRPVEGRVDADTSVEFVDERTTRITNRTAGVITQVIVNTLSEDGDTIENEYVRLDQDGKIVRVTHATYERVR